MKKSKNMENNAANTVRSTENTTKNQTTFRLGLHLSTAQLFSVGKNA